MSLSSRKVETLNVSNILFFDILSDDPHSEILRKAQEEQKRLVLFYHPDKLTEATLPNRLKVIGVTCELTENHYEQLRAKRTVIFEKRASTKAVLFNRSSTWHMHYCNAIGEYFEQEVTGDNEQILRQIFHELKVSQESSVTLPMADKEVTSVSGKTRASFGSSKGLSQDVLGKTVLDVVNAVYPPMVTMCQTGVEAAFNKIENAFGEIKKSAKTHSSGDVNFSEITAVINDVKTHYYGLSNVYNFDAISAVVTEVRGINPSESIKMKFKKITAVINDVKTHAFKAITAAYELVQDQHKLIAYCRPAIQELISRQSTTLHEKCASNSSSSDVESYLRQLGNDEQRYLVITYPLQVSGARDIQFSSVLAQVLYANNSERLLVLFRSLKKSPEFLDKLLEQPVQEGDAPLLRVIIARYFSRLFSVDFTVALLETLSPKSQAAYLSEHAALGENGAVNEQAVWQVVTKNTHNSPALYKKFNEYCEGTVEIFMNARGNESLLQYLYGEERVARLIAAAGNETEFRKILREYMTEALNYLKRHLDKGAVFRELYGHQAAARLAVTSYGETLLSDLLKHHPDRVMDVLNVLNVETGLSQLEHVSDREGNKAFQILVKHNHIACFSQMVIYLNSQPEILKWHLASCLYDIFSFTDNKMQAHEIERQQFERLYEESDELRKKAKEMQRKSAPTMRQRFSTVRLSSEELNQQAEAKDQQANACRRQYEAVRAGFYKEYRRFIAAVPKKVFKQVLQEHDKEVLNFALKAKNTESLITILDQFDVINYLKETSDFLCSAVANKDRFCFGELMFHLFSEECLEAIRKEEKANITSGKRLALTGRGSVSAGNSDSQQAVYSEGNLEVIFINRILVDVLIAIFSELSGELRDKFLLRITHSYFLSAMLKARDEYGFSVLHAAFEGGAKSFMNVLDHDLIPAEIRVALIAQVKEKFESIIREQEARPENERNVREVKSYQQKLIKLAFLTSEIESFKSLLLNVPESERFQAIKEARDEKNETILVRALEQSDDALYIEISRLLPIDDRLTAIEESLDSSNKSILSVVLSEKKLMHFKEIFSLLRPEDQKIIASGRLGISILQLALDDEAVDFYKEIISLMPDDMRLTKVQEAKNRQMETVLQWALRSERDALHSQILELLPDGARYQVVASPPRIERSPRNQRPAVGAMIPERRMGEAVAEDQSVLGRALNCGLKSLSVSRQKVKVNVKSTGVSSAEGSPLSYEEMSSGGDVESNKATEQEVAVMDNREGMFLGALVQLQPSERLAAVQNYDATFLSRNVVNEVVPIEHILEVLSESDRPVALTKIFPQILSLQSEQRKNYLARFPSNVLMAALAIQVEGGGKYFHQLAKSDKREFISKFLIANDDGDAAIEGENKFSLAFTTPATVRLGCFSRKVTTTLANYINNKILGENPDENGLNKAFEIVCAYCQEDIAALKTAVAIPRGFFSVNSLKLFSAVEQHLSEDDFIRRLSESSIRPTACILNQPAAAFSSLLGGSSPAQSIDAVAESDSVKSRSTSPAPSGADDID